MRFRPTVGTRAVGWVVPACAVGLTALTFACGDGERAAGGQGGAGASVGVGAAGAGGGADVCLHEGCPCVRGTVVDCYSGPPETANVGICKTAKVTCENDQMIPEWCPNEVTPRDETCLDEVDEDCDGARCAEHRWGHLYGDEAYDRVLAVDIAKPSGNVVAVGEFGGTIDFGDGAISVAAPQQYDGFVAILDPDGNALRTIHAQSTGATQVGRVAFDPDENIIVTGSFHSTLDLDVEADLANDTLTSSDLSGYGAFIAKYAADGSAIVFSELLDNVTELDIDVADDGKIALAAGNTLRIYDPSGAVLHSMTLGPVNSNFRAVAFDVTGSLVVVGENGSADTLPTNPPIALPGQPVGILAEWMTKLTPDLAAAEWFRPLGTDCQVARMDVDPQGHVALVGRAEAGCDLDGAPFTERTSYIATFGSSGDPQWLRRFQPNQVPDAPTARDVRFDAQGNVVTVGVLHAPTSIDGGGSILSGLTDSGYVVKLDPAGGYVYSGSFDGHDGDDAATGIAAWPSGEVLIGGYLLGWANLGGENLPAGGAWDAFLARYGP